MQRNPWNATACVAAAALALAGCGHGEFGPSATQFRPPRNEDVYRYTILLETFVDPATHVQQAERYRGETAKHAGWTGLHVVNKPDHSELRWGKYRSQEDAEKNLKAAKAYVAPAGYKIYFKAMILPLAVEAVDSPQYDLANANGYYTVLVAVFYDVPEAKYVGRQQFAVEYCKQLRAQFQEAYVYHDPTRSAVTVGTFPQAAIRLEKAGNVEKPVIADARMQGIIEHFQYLAVNGRKEIIAVPMQEQERSIRLDPKLYGKDKEEAMAKMKLAAEGKNVGYQRPYPVRIPHKSVVNEPKTNRSVGDRQPGEAAGDSPGPR